MDTTSPAGDGHAESIKIAAAGDIHCRESRRAEVTSAFENLGSSNPDLVLLAGDLTSDGEPSEAEMLADCCSSMRCPVFAVLGNHDWHVNRRDELVDALQASGITVLDGEWAISEVKGAEVGIVGVKGFVGGFPGSHLPDFGEPLLREVYAETSRQTEALDRGLREVALCPIRIALMHYSPTADTLVGEPEGIWAFLGSDRMAAPLLEHSPDLALHGHAHIGQFRASIGDVPVFNVSIPVMGQDFWVFELDVPAQSTPIH